MRKINDLLRPAPLGKAVIKGSVAYQMERFFFHRVLSDEARKVIYRETEDAFRTKFDGSTAVGWWQGEFWGKWVISACRVCAYTGDQTLSAHLLNAGRTLLSLAREDGYIGTYEDSENVFPAERSVAHGEPLPPENTSGFARSRTEIKIGAVRYSDQPDEDTVRLHVDAEIPGTGKTLSLCDFATGSNHFSDDDPNFFSIWL